MKLYQNQVKKRDIQPSILLDDFLLHITVANMRSKSFHRTIRQSKIYFLYLLLYLVLIFKYNER
jgi:hypothetical protein